MNVAREEQSLVDQFEATLPFRLDAFQREAIEKLDRSAGGVLVSAPTSSGKTIVAEYAIFRALREGAKVLYTTPLKALSNQKYHDFVRIHGESGVGLVTATTARSPTGWPRTVAAWRPSSTTSGRSS